MVRSYALKFGLPLLGVALLGLALLHVARAQSSAPRVGPPAEPARTPFGSTVAGTGMVEAQTENIAVGTPVSGVVAEVLVRVGQKVTAGTPLFRLDDRHLRAELEARQTSRAVEEAQLARLLSPPRPERVKG